MCVYKTTANLNQFMLLTAHLFMCNSKRDSCLDRYRCKYQPDTDLDLTQPVKSSSICTYGNFCDFYLFFAK